MDLTTLKATAAKAADVRTNLYNTGLTMAGCDTAYRAALRASGDPAVAWEAAREHMLLCMLPREVNTHTQANYGGGNTYDAIAGRDRYTQQDYDNRVAQMQAVTDLTNPFAN